MGRIDVLLSGVSSGRIVSVVPVDVLCENRFLLRCSHRYRMESSLPLLISCSITPFKAWDCRYSCHSGLWTTSCIKSVSAFGRLNGGLPIASQSLSPSSKRTSVFFWSLLSAQIFVGIFRTSLLEGPSSGELLAPCSTCVMSIGKGGSDFPSLLIRG